MTKVTYRTFLPALIFVFLFSSSFAFGQDPVGPQPKKARTPADYTLRTLREIAELGSTIAAERDDEMKGDATTLTHGDLLPSRVRVVYKGSMRPTTKVKKEVISYWSNKYAGAPQHYIVAYTHEALFGEAGRNHWLVVNKRIVPRLKREFKKGQAVDVHLIRMGAYKSGDDWRWVLLVEDFAPAK